MGDSQARGEAHLEMGRIYLTQGDCGNAAAHLQVACALGSRAADAWFLLGRAQVGMGDLEDGIATLRHATGEWEMGGGDEVERAWVMR